MLGSSRGRELRTCGKERDIMMWDLGSNSRILNRSNANNN